MTALAAVCADESQNVEDSVHAMLSAMKHRGSETIIARDKQHPSTVLGWAGSLNEERFFESDRGAFALDGTFYKRSKRSLAHTALLQATDGLTSIMPMAGAFAILCARKKRLHALRDPNGLKPLYCSHSDGLTAVASERKALWRIGLKQVDRVLPGYLYTVTSQKVTRKRLFKLQPPVEQQMSLEHASNTLKRLLIRSTHLITNDVKRVAVAFSGGLDSSITALLAKQSNLEVELISTGLDGSEELQTVEEYAKELDLPISIKTYGIDSVEEYLHRVLWLIEEPDLMKVSIAIPLHWAALLASRRGHSIMLCGQGSDELYGGYYRYARILDNLGRRALLAELYRSVVESPQVNYERDEQATCPTGVELRTPFANLEVIQFSFQIPLEFKVKKGNDLMRKWILRETARKAGLPESLVWRRKKAIQHGTGVEKAIRKLAKGQQLTTSSYLTKIYNTLSPELMP